MTKPFPASSFDVIDGSCILDLAARQRVLAGAHRLLVGQLLKLSAVRTLETDRGGLEG